MSEPVPPPMAGPAGPEGWACAVCGAQRRAVIDLLIQWQHALTISEAERQTFGESRGLCPFHMWLLRQIGDPLSLSKALAPVVNAWVIQLREMRDAPDHGAASIRSALPEQDACRACRTQRDAGAAALARLLAELPPRDMGGERRSGAALCLRHLAAALRSAPTRAAARTLLTEQEARLEEVAGQLSRYIEKREALRRDQIGEDEHEAWRRALEAVAGARIVGNGAGG